MCEKRSREAQARELAVELCRNRGAELLRYARSHCFSMAVAEEALQEALISFLRSYDPGGGAPPIAWLKLALKRQCWRRQERERWDRRAGQECELCEEVRGFALELLPAQGSGPEERIAERDEATPRLAPLKADQRTGLGLLAAGFSYKEIAARRGWSYTKVNRCVREGRGRMAIT
jgi:DNA-directed RNA polymerase specialized sigma24 family protein